MRVNPGESSYADIIDYEAERQAAIDVAIAKREPEARERAACYFDDNAGTSSAVFCAIAEHPSIADALVYAVNAGDDAELGRKLSRAVAAARIMWVNDMWRKFAAFSVDIGRHTFLPPWPATDADLHRTFGEVSE